MNIDDTTQRLIDLLRETLEAEPGEADTDPYSPYLAAETDLLHYEWQRKVDALRLLVGARLVTLALEQA